MEKELIIVFIVLLILFIIYILIQKTDVCSIIHRNEKEDFSVGAKLKNWHKGAVGLGAIGAMGTGMYLLSGCHEGKIKYDCTDKICNTDSNKCERIKVDDLVKIDLYMGEMLYTESGSQIMEKNNDQEEGYKQLINGEHGIVINILPYNVEGNIQEVVLQMVSGRGDEISAKIDIQHLELKNKAVTGLWARSIAQNMERGGLVVYNQTINEWVKKIIDSSKEEVSGTASQFGTNIKNTFDETIGGVAGGVAGGARDAYTGLTGGARDAYTGLTGGARDAYTGLAGGASAAYTEVTDGVRDVYTELAEAAEGISNAAISVVDNEEIQAKRNFTETATEQAKKTFPSGYKYKNIYKIKLNTGNLLDAATQSFPKVYKRCFYGESGNGQHIYELKRDKKIRYKPAHLQPTTIFIIKEGQESSQLNPLSFYPVWGDNIVVWDKTNQKWILPDENIKDHCIKIKEVTKSITINGFVNDGQRLSQKIDNIHQIRKEHWCEGENCEFR